MKRVKKRRRAYPFGLSLEPRFTGLKLRFSGELRLKPRWRVRRRRHASPEQVALGFMALPRGRRRRRVRDLDEEIRRAVHAAVREAAARLRALRERERRKEEERQRLEHEKKG